MTGSRKVSKSSMVRALATHTSATLAQICHTLAIPYSQGYQAISKPKAKRASKSELARFMKKELQIPVAFVASALGMTYSHAYRA